MPLENPKNQPGKKPTAPKLRKAVKKQVDQGIRARAERLLVKIDLKEKLSPKNLLQFVQNHPIDSYLSYRKWNGDFCNAVLGLESATSSDQAVRVTALQIFLNKEIGGFTEKLNQRDSIDGKLGPFTLGKLKSYIEKISKTGIKKSVEPLKPSTDAIASRLKSNERFDPNAVFYTGDSIMVGILARKGVKKSNRRALDGSRLVHYKTSSLAYKKRFICIEDEALKYLENPNCKLLVLNGGVNDIYTFGGSKTVIERIKKTYKKIIDTAHKKRKKVAIYSLNSTFLPKSKETQRIRRINNACEEINEWLVKESGADMVVNTDKITKRRVSKKDGLHITARASKELFNELEKQTQSSSA